ncbi:MAG: GntR family transcriptional regulator [Dermatophilaceae bacterium]
MRAVPEIQHVLPKYLQIAGHIRDQIVRGDLLPGAEVPSERELATSWGVARPTAARALHALRSQGLVSSVRGSGTYVRDPGAAPRARERYERAIDGASMYGQGEKVEFLSTELTSAPPHVADALQLEDSAQVVRRARLLRNADARVIELSTSWFAGELAIAAPRLLEPERLVGGTARYLAEVTGRQASYGRDQVAARLATPKEARLLRLVEPAAVLTYRFTVFTTDDRPIQTDDSTYPPEQWAFRQEYSLT